MHILANSILILGVCLGVIGAAGFTEPVQDGAYAFFAAGVLGWQRWSNCCTAANC